MVSRTLAIRLRESHVDVLMLLALFLMLCLLPIVAFAVSSWNPTLLVNTEAFQEIDETDSASNLTLRFGSTLNAQLFYDRSWNRFNFTKSVYIQGNLAITGALKLYSVTNSGGLVYSSGTSLRVSATGNSGQIILSQGQQTPRWVSPVTSMVWYLDGTQSIGTSKGAKVTMPFGFTASGVKLNITGAPTGAALIVDIKKDGTTIFSTKPQIDASATSGGGGGVLSTTDLTRNSVISIDITQVGSTFAGSGLTIMLNGIRKF